MARGKAFEHKKKGHPGDFPADSFVSKENQKPLEDEEFIVTQEAFKNRVEGVKQDNP
ncbi:hypothetical protein [Bacillus coahuilensis]|uniref:hypothetical protein n=1 Tax=Bacillus coahuilensis TaxID=408580 RepID=UPI0001850A97|nr:hypothetical protein [Bacillus coahuilensis]